LEPDTPTKRAKIAPPLTGPDDPIFASKFLVTHRIAAYSEYWGKGKDNVVKNNNEFRPQSPGLFPLYLFGQYNYILNRIESFRSLSQKAKTPPGVAIIGTPGIGEPLCSLP